MIKHKAIRNAYPTVVTINDNSAFDKDGNTVILDDALVQIEVDKLQAEYDAQDYARKRKIAYPDIYDYMDGIVKDDQTQINKYIADSQAVKARYPKG
tara:strand:- start:31 stop:321 length:291 start_codon:yes stop_codon:yes gene_type:complete